MGSSSRTPSSKRRPFSWKDSLVASVRALYFASMDKITTRCSYANGAKGNCNHCLILCFLHQKFKKGFKLENMLKFSHIIKSSILFYKCSKYEIILLTFGPSK
jgi:hypothetical protein